MISTRLDQAKSKGVKVSESQNLRVSGSQGLKVSGYQGLKRVQRMTNAIWRNLKPMNHTLQWIKKLLSHLKLLSFYTGETRNNLICININGLLLQVQPVPNTIWPTVFSCPEGVSTSGSSIFTLRNSQSEANPSSFLPPTIGPVISLFSVPPPPLFTPETFPPFPKSEVLPDSCCKLGYFCHFILITNLILINIICTLFIP